MIKCNHNMIKWDHKNDQLGSWKWSIGIINMINWDHENDQKESWIWLNGIIIWLIIDTYLWCIYFNKIDTNIENSLLYIFIYK